MKNDISIYTQDMKESHIPLSSQDHIQAEHKECQPFYFALDIEPNVVSCELLVRSRSTIKCNCTNYATESQRNWIIQFADSIFEKLEITT